ncbi:TPA: antitermination protein [Klebsiella oxytoca]|nr:antitermination protein [Klebsiella oxytoca]HEJ0352002.1 antitermination protein [Klebsiella oxytoca]
MKLESALKHFSPQGLRISDNVNSTSPERLTGTDIKAALGTTCCRVRFGLAAFFGKAGVSENDERSAIKALTRYAMEIAPKNVRKAAGGEFGWCMNIMADYAFAEYSRSASTCVVCSNCSGSGITSHCEEVIKHPGIINAVGVEIIPPKIKCERVEKLCLICKGKGKIQARCRCGGKGEILDRAASEENGKPIFKQCGRCSGRGFSSVSSATIHRVIIKRLPELHQSSWSRNWKPFYEQLVDVCKNEERRAAVEFERITKL